MTMWELPKFSTIAEAKVVLRKIAKACIKMQTIKAKNLSTKRTERQKVNEFFDQFIMECDDEADNYEMEYEITQNARDKRMMENWINVRNAAIKKRDKLIRAKETVYDLSKAF